jgi:TolB-like protein
MTRYPLVLSCLLLTATACATSPVRRRAMAIDEADRQARQAVSLEASIDAASIPARTLSVLPFVVAERDTILTPLGYGMAELLASDLARTPQLRLVERRHIEAIYRELSLVDSGVSDPRAAPRVGRLVGARRVLLGSVSLAPNNEIQFTTRLVDVIAGTVEGLVTASAPLDRILDAEKALAFRLFDELGITLTPAQRAAVEQRQTASLVAVLAFGRGVQAEVKGDAAGAQAGFSEAARLDPGFAQARAEVAGSAGAATAGVGVQRVLASSETAINAPVATRTPEVADAPLTTRQLITLLISLTIF